MFAFARLNSVMYPEDNGCGLKTDRFTASESLGTPVSRIMIRETSLIPDSECPCDHGVVTVQPSWGDPLAIDWTMNTRLTYVAKSRAESREIDKNRQNGVCAANNGHQKQIEAIINYSSKGIFT